MDELLFTPAIELRDLLVSGRLSARELTAAHLDQIDRINPTINAIVTVVAERAMAAAQAADDVLVAGGEPGLLHGLPVAHKDLHDTAGIRTTHGSPLFADNVPETSALIVERMWLAGAVPLGKTNTPEFGAGSQTYNTLFGATANPYDPSRTCGGSSGGAAAALAAGMISLADGSDYGASLRNPASFCNVVGLRPTPGRVPTWPTLHAWWTGSVHGPMARTVDDVALLLSSVAGPDRRIPISLQEPGAAFAAPIDPAPAGTRIAWSSDLGGLPIDPAVTAVLEPHRDTLAGLGFEVTEAEPDLAGYEEAFLAWRFWRTVTDLGDTAAANPDQVKPEIAWTVERGRELTALDLGRADIVRSRVFARAAAFFEHHDYLVCPVTQVPPFPIEQHWVERIGTVEMEHFLAWIRSCYAISVIESPAASVPAGFTDDGLPIGIQIVGRRGDDLGVLRVAKAFEEATGFWMRRPPLASAG